MIFKTFDSNIDKWTSKVGILGTSFDDIGNRFKKMADELSIANDYTIPSIANAGKNTSSKKDLSNKFIITRNDIQDKLIKVDELYKPLNNSGANNILTQLQKIDTQVQKGEGTWNNYFNGLKEGQKWQIDFVKDTDLQTASTEDVLKAQNAARDSAIKYNNSLKQMTLSAKVGAIAMKALSTAGNIILFTLISKGIESAITAIDNWIHRVDRANDVMVDAVSEYESTKSSLENINSELEEQNKKIEELQLKDKLTYAEKGQLEELQKITEELLIQQDIEERRAERASKEAANKTINAYKEQYGKYDISENDLNEKLNYTEMTGIFPLAENENDVTGNIASLIRAKELLNESQKEYSGALKSGEDTEWFAENVQYYVDMVGDISEQLDTNISDLQEKRLALGDEYDKAIEKRQNGAEPLTTSEKETIKTYESITKAIRLIYEYKSQNDWNNMEFSNIFATEGIEKTKAELIQMSKAGELTPEVIGGYKNLNNAIENSELFLKNGQTAAEAFCNELYALAETEGEVYDASNEAPISSISGTIDKLNTQLKPTFDSLKSAYQDIFTENGFVRENIDLSMFSDIKSTLDNLSELGLAVDYSSFEDFYRVLNDTESTAEDIHNAFDDLATAISQVAISGAEDFEMLKSALKDFGVENSEMVAFSNLANNTEALKEAGLDIADASKEQMKAFAEEYVAAENVTQAVNMLTYAKQLSQIENMDTSGEIANLKTLAENAGYTGDVIQYLTELEQIYQEIASGTLTPGNLDRKLKRADELQNLIKNSSSKIDYNPTEFVGKSGTSSASSAGQDAADAYLEAFENELSELDTLKDRGKITEKQYLDALRKLYVKYYNDKEKYLDQYEKYEYQYLSGMKSLYESAFSYIVKQIDKRIDALRKESESQVANLEAQKKAAEEFYQSQIDDIDDQIESIDKEIAAKQDLIDAINDAAEARKREIDLQKAQYDLERMQNQKTNYVYKDGQMIYEADSTGIRDARENVEDAKREVEIAAVEKVIEGLEKQRDILEEQKEALEQALEASNAYWDAQIEQTEQYFDTLITGMEEYKSRWEELSEIEENAKMNLALEELGITEQDILGMSTEAFNNVKQAYMNILADMYNGNDQLLMQLSALSGIQLSDLTGYLDGTVDALDRLNQMDLEETNKSISGISGSFDSIAASAGSAASAIDGGSGGGDVQDNASGENNTPGNGGGGSGKSILNSIQTLSTEGVDNINKVANAFAGSNEDEQSGVSVAGAVQQVIDKVVSGQAKSKNPNGNDTKAPTGKSSNSLMSAIQDQTEAALDIESGIPAQEKAWENLNEPLDKANELILSIKNSLEGMDGKEFSVTLSVHGPGIIGTVIKGIMGNAEVEGTALLQGDWGAKKSRKSLVGELGQELIVRGSRFFTVGNNGAEMFNVQKGEIIFNHEQTEQLLKHGRISSRGTSYADGTTNTFPDYLTPIDQSSDEYSIFSQFNEYLKKSTDMFSSAGSLHRPLEEIADSVSMIEHTVNNRNMNAMRTFEINIGDINLEGVQDVNSLSSAIVTRLPNLVIQELHRS